MTQLRRLFFFALVLAGSQLSAGCYLGYTNRPVLFPNVAVTPTRPLTGGYGCCGSLLPGWRGGGSPAPLVGGPVYDAPLAVSGPAPMYGGPVGFDGYGFNAGLPAGIGTPGCTNCGTSSGYAGIPQGIPIAGAAGGPPIATSPTIPFGPPVVPSGGSVPNVMPSGPPVQGVPFDPGLVPTLKPPAGSVPLQMPKEVKESKKLVSADK